MCKPYSFSSKLLSFNYISLIYFSICEIVQVTEVGMECSIFPDKINGNIFLLNSFLLSGRAFRSELKLLSKE